MLCSCHSSHTPAWTPEVFHGAELKSFHKCVHLLIQVAATCPGENSGVCHRWKMGLIDTETIDSLCLIVKFCMATIIKILACYISKYRREVKEKPLKY